MTATTARYRVDHIIRTNEGPAGFYGQDYVDTDGPLADYNALTKRPRPAALGERVAHVRVWTWRKRFPLAPEHTGYWDVAWDLPRLAAERLPELLAMAEAEVARWEARA